jgi:Ca-activated chloride channel family protein
MSMTATDVAPTRLDAEKAAATAFVNQLPPQYNVSVVALSGSPSSLGPPSTDRGMVLRMINSLQPTNGTAIGDAINDGLSTIAQAPTNGNDTTPAPALMILLSDGTNTKGSDPLAAAQLAAQQKVPIHTIAFGTMNGYVDIDGQRANVAPDKGLLGQISQITGAKALDAASASQLDSVYTTLKSEVGYDAVYKEVTARWALYALAFAVVAALGAVSMAARWP